MIDRGQPYKDALKSFVLKPEGHIQEKHQENRLYAVTTIAQSDQYGGTRTPVICYTLDRAKEIVETNEGDIWETTYHFTVIEGVIPDHLYTCHKEQYWYQWKVCIGRLRHLRSSVIPLGLVWDEPL